MKILISNDDGITAPGLNALLLPLQEAGHQVIVVAPASENSACSHAITVHDPIFVNEYKFMDKNIKGWKVIGKPADCVKIALEVLLKDELPDLVIAGINCGPNLGIDTMYSGTVSAALEASMHNIPAIAFSLESRLPEADYSLAATYAVKIVAKYRSFNLPKSTMLNVNIPYTNEENIRGIRLTKLGNILYDNVFSPRQDLRGRTYYWLGGEMLKNAHINIDYDVDALTQNWITVTPLHYDLTDIASMEKLRKIKF